MCEEWKQFSIYDFPQYLPDDMKENVERRVSISKPIRLIELFAGYGSQAMALRNIGAEFEHYRVVEFDKYAIKSYNAVHGTNFPTIDIREFSGNDLGIVEKDKYTYILTYSFPCTDLSLSGKQAGMKRGVEHDRGYCGKSKDY